ncbi:MAG: aminotransferase class III-fold pyridoxal phosphate-dependent enzyme [Planctomycetes bacterium]|nr:aminotransferase class III-fold pyridoxal phosphate-dependent enzyme [Planctomycetota bacterium]
MSADAADSTERAPRIDLTRPWRFLSPRGTLRRRDGAVVRAVEPGELESALSERFPDFGPWKLFPTRGRAIEGVLESARAATGRPQILRFRGCRHGFLDEPAPQPPARGRAGVVRFGLDAAADAAGQRFLRFQDAATVEALLGAPQTPIGALLLEPVPMRMGLAIPAPDFVPRLREATSQSGTLLIFDEGSSALRFGARGSGPRLGAMPDVLVFGESLTAGLPFGAAAFSRAAQSSWNLALACCDAGVPSDAALVAALESLDATTDPAPAAHLEALGARLARGLESILADLESRASVARLGSVIFLYFPGSGLSDPSHPARYDWARTRAWSEALAARGIRVSPHPMDPMFLADDLRPADLDAVLAAAGDALERIGDAL